MTNTTDHEAAAEAILSKLPEYSSLSEAVRAFQELFPVEFSNFDKARSFLRLRQDKYSPPTTSDDSRASFDENLTKGTGQFDFKGKLDKPMSVDELLIAHGVNTAIYEVERMKVNSWGVTAKMGSCENGDERLEAAKNYQLSIWLRKKVTSAPESLLDNSANAILESVKRVIGDQAKASNITTKKVVHPAFQTGEADPNKMLEVSIFDLHMGKLAWAEETGFANWDSKIAASAALEALDDLLQFFPNYGRIWLPLGHDFFNSDGPGDNDSGGRTTRGTSQDEDSRWAKSYYTGIDVALSMIERAKEFAPVDVMIMRGNHDEVRCVSMGKLLAEVYKNDPHVTVDDGLGTLKHYTWGDCFLATHHGQMESLQKVVTECAIKFPDFGSAKWREIHSGHGHRMKSAGMVIDGVEEQSVRHRMIPSMCSPDNWHSRNLYHNNPCAETYLWDKKDLYVGHHSHNRSRLLK